jgi:quercetin 2,3-dioxygenase
MMATSHQHRIVRVQTVPALAPGFAGPGHLATRVLSPDDFVDNDPFILLTDDRLDIGERPVSRPHPHAGFETVTLVVDGAIYDRDEGGAIAAGEVQWMTAGRGIIHGENVATRGKARLLQMWLTLPGAERWTEPTFQDLCGDAIPVRREDGVDVRVYSGSSAGVRSATRNHVPVTFVEITMAPRATIDQDIPAGYNGFVFVLRGSTRIGRNAVLLETDQVGWLDRRGNGVGAGSLRVLASDEGARLVLYAGQPQRDRIVSRGPFVGDSEADISRLFAEYRAGSFERMSELARRKRRGDGIA